MHVQSLDDDDEDNARFAPGHFGQDDGDHNDDGGDDYHEGEASQLIQQG